MENHDSQDLEPPGDATHTPGPSDSGEEEGVSLKQWVMPLFVIPATIVISMVLILVLFFILTAEEHTPRENLERVMSGGRNERKQAAFELQRQLQNIQAENLELDSGFNADLTRTFERALADEEEDVQIICYLAMVLGYMKDPGSVPILTQALEDPREVDVSGSVLSVQWSAAFALASIGTAGTAEPLRKVLQTSPDKGLRIIAANGLGQLGSAEAAGALKEALGDPEREVRWNAALSLAQMGEREAALEPLREILDPANKDLWRDERARLESMRLAIGALTVLKDRESLPLLRALDQDGESLKIRDLAKKGIQKLEAE